MTKYVKEVELEDGWTREVIPVMNGYKMACCDCGLVHDINFVATKIIEALPDGRFKYKHLPKDKYGVALRARRNNRATAAKRRKTKKRKINKGNK